MVNSKNIEIKETVSILGFLCFFAQNPSRVYNSIMEITIQSKIAHLRDHFSFEEEELAEIEKLYSGKEYDPQSKGILHLKEESRKLCDEWNSLYTGIRPKSVDNKRKKQILKLLFPGLPSDHGSIRRNMHLVIGMVEASSYTFINVGADFGENTIVKLGVWAQIGPNFSVCEEKTGPAKTIVVGKDAWLGGKVKVEAGSRIGEESVIGAGAFVRGEIPAKKLALGRPAVAKKDIGIHDPMSIKESSVYTSEEIAHIASHYKKAKHGLPRKTINRIFTGHAFSTLSVRLGMLYLYTHGLCMKLDNPNLSENERALIIAQLFPIHGKNVQIGRHFFLDLCGVVSLGDNVTIGDNVCLGGLIRIGSNVSIGNGCVFFSSNHPLSPKERKVGFHEGLGLSIPIYLSPIEIGDNVKIGNDVALAPFCKINSDIADDMLVLAKGNQVPLP